MDVGNYLSHIIPLFNGVIGYSWDIEGKGASMRTMSYVSKQVQKVSLGWFSSGSTDNNYLLAASAVYCQHLSVAQAT